MKYNRTYNDIPTEDNIELWLNPNSDLSYYHKNWNMDLDEFSSSYSLTKTEAEDIALALAGEGSVIDESFLIIIRPNYFWTIGGFMYGAAPPLAWEIRIIHHNNLQKVYHIDANTEEIIGGDSALA